MKLMVFTDREKSDFLHALGYEVRELSEWAEKPIHGSRTYMEKEERTWAIKDGLRFSLDEAFKRELKIKLLNL